MELCHQTSSAPRSPKDGDWLIPLFIYAALVRWREVVISSGCSSFCSEGCHRRTGVFFLGAQGWIHGEEDWIMTKLVRLAICLTVAAVVCVAQDVVSVVRGTVTKVDN